MFSKAKVKRFNEDIGCAPAPNAYDSKLPVRKGTGIATSKSRRFQEGKDEVPGPGQYLLPPVLGQKPLSRSSSFRLGRYTATNSRTDLTMNSTNCSTRSELFQTPCSTPRKLRRSISTGNVSSVFSPISNLRETINGDDSLEVLRGRVEKLTMEKIELEKKFTGPSNDRRLEQESLEQMKAELETCRGELRLRNEELVEALHSKDVLTRRLDNVQADSARMSTLRSEVNLLNQDNKTLEEELEASREAREKIENELVEMREVRQDMEKKVQEEDAKNVFLHFTQEQLNSQVLSLEDIVKNLKVENQLLNRAIQKLVVNLGDEKSHLEEMTEQYNTENMESEQEFRELQEELMMVKSESKKQEIEFRAKLGEAQVVEIELRQEKDEIIEVLENDKSALKDAFDIAEETKNKLELDLAQACRQSTELRSELDEMEMSRAGLEGEVNSLRNEVEQKDSEIVQLKEQVDGLEGEKDIVKTEISKTTEAHATLLAQYGEQEEILQQNKDVIKRMEELQELSQEQVDMLKNEMKESSEEGSKLQEQKAIWLETEVKLHEKIEKLDSEMMAKIQMEAELCEKIQSQNEELSQMENEVSTMTRTESGLVESLENLKVEKAEVEEALLDTQGLVETMEETLEMAHNGHREEVRQLVEKVRLTESRVDNLTEERTTLLEMNTGLSGQVSDGHHSIHQLQVREDGLLQEVEMLRQFMEGAQQDGEQDRIRLMQAEDEILSLQAELEATVLEMDQVAHTSAHKMATVQEQLNMEMANVKEDLGSQLDTVKNAYNSVVEELRESKTVGRQLLDQLTNVEGEVNKKQVENEKLVTDFEMRNREALDEMKRIKTTFQSEVELQKENISHLEKLRDNLELSLSEKTEILATRVRDEEVIKAHLAEVTEKSEELNKTNLRLKANLDLRAAEAMKLKESNDCHKSQLKDENTKLIEMTKQKEELNTQRMKEMEMCVQLRETIEEMKTKLEEGESAWRSVEAQQVLLQEAEGRVEEAEGKAEQWKIKMGEVEEIMNDMEKRIDELEKEANYFKEQHGILQELIEPFKDQLEAFEVEKRSILGQKEDAMGEMKKLSAQYATLLGHQNHKQKIHHVVKLKEENVGLRTEMGNMQEQLLKAKRNCSRLEEKLKEAQGLKRFDSRLSFQPHIDRETPKSGNINKENSMVPPATPLSAKPTGRPSRQSTGSPLRVNRN